MRLQNSHTRIGKRRRPTATLIAMVAVGLMAGTVFAGKPDRTPSPTGSCSVTPGQVAAAS